MRRIFPAPRYSPTHGFTLVEVLIALLLAVILISVTASTLGVTLRAEQSMDLMEAGERLIHSLQTDLYIHGQGSNTVRRFNEEWVVTSTRIETGDVTNRVAWDVWEITAKARPSVQWRLAQHAVKK